MPRSKPHEDDLELPRLTYGRGRLSGFALYREAPRPDGAGLRDFLQGVPRLRKADVATIVKTLELEALANLQAVKFDPTYGRLWRDIERARGRDEVVQALARLRRGEDRADAPSRALLKLASFPVLRSFGPVDPNDHEDLPELKVWTRGTDSPWWILPHFGFHDALSRGESWQGESDPLLLDLTLPVGELEVGLRLCKGLAGIPTTSRRQARREWDGERGWRMAFWLLRQTQLRPSRKLVDRARDYIGRLRELGILRAKSPSPALETGTVGELLRAAKQRVGEVAREVDSHADWVDWANEHLLSDTAVQPDDVLDRPVPGDTLVLDPTRVPPELRPGPAAD